MKWYHYTGLSQFKEIIVDEALLSFYQKWRETEPPCIVEMIQRNKISEDKKEYHRQDNVFLAPDTSMHRGSYHGLVLGFELDQTPNFGSCLALPKVSLDKLVDIGAEKIILPSVKEILQVSHKGKYKDIPVYQSE